MTSSAVYVHEMRLSIERQEIDGEMTSEDLKKLSTGHSIRTVVVMKCRLWRHFIQHNMSLLNRITFV
jgi:hypothetical protein